MSESVMWTTQSCKSTDQPWMCILLTYHWSIDARNVLQVVDKSMDGTIDMHNSNCMLTSLGDTPFFQRESHTVNLCAVSLQYQLVPLQNISKNN